MIFDNCFTNWTLQKFMTKLICLRIAWPSGGGGVTVSHNLMLLLLLLLSPGIVFCLEDPFPIFPSLPLDFRALSVVPSVYNSIVQIKTDLTTPLSPLLVDDYKYF